jgi:ribose 1,5-bisphosphokinase
MHWQAHGLFYGIGIEVESWRRAGLVVVVSGSRAHFDAHLAAAEGVTPVLVTCAADILAKRLLARGRETAQQISERLDRAPAPPTHPALVTIDNSGPIEQAGERLVALLTSLASAGELSRRG